MVTPKEVGHLQVTTAWLAEHIADPSALGIASTVTRMVRQGDIQPGSRLPTVRALAARLVVSPATVSAAWMTLRKQRIIDGSGRQGTWVLDGPRMIVPERFDHVAKFWKGGALDLSAAVPDPALLPDPYHAIARAHRDPNINSYARPDIIPALEEAVAPTWEWQPEQWLAVNGGYEGLGLLITSRVVPGDYVAVADPSTPRVLDILEQAGARTLPVETDNEGPKTASLMQALQRQPVAFVYEPRSSSRIGATLSGQRRDDLATVLEGTECLIIEDDGLGELSRAPYKGLGALFPARSVLIRTYSKSHGPDLRLAVIGGASDPVERARRLKQFGSGWTSRVLQGALAWMLSDDATCRQVAHARETYTERRHNMIHLFAERGVTVPDRDGLSISVPLLSEERGLLVLASHGIASDSDRSSSIRSTPPVARLATGIDLPEPERIADAYTMAALAF